MSLLKTPWEKFLEFPASLELLYDVKDVTHYGITVHTDGWVTSSSLSGASGPIDLKLDICVCCNNTECRAKES